MKLTVSEGDLVAAEFSPEARAARKFELHLARLGSDLKINVKAGENSGRKLLHDFVILSLTKEEMNADTKQLRLPASGASQTAGSRQAVAAWITLSGQLEPIQAVGGWLR